MNRAKKNYSTTKKEAFAMIYAIKNFRHYLLGNSFTYFVDHQTLIYLVNKLIVIGQIAHWLLLLQEFNFKVMMTLKRSENLSPYSQDHIHFMEKNYINWDQGYLSTMSFTYQRKCYLYQTS
jgi:hypothetical protein